MTAPVRAYDPESLLLLYQQALVEDESDLIICEKSRRTGVTWGQAAKATLKASTRKSDGGRNHFYVGSNKEMAVEFIEAVAMWAKAFDKACGDIVEEVLEDEDKDILTYTVRFASGFKIQALSSNPSNMRGRQGDVTIDEAAFHDRLGEVLKAALALTMWGAQITLISTHNGVDNLFNEIIQDSRAGKKDYNVHRLTLDAACEQGLYKRICQIRGIEWSADAEQAWKDKLLNATATREDALEEYYCVPKQGGGAYLSRALIESRMIDTPVLRFEGTDEFNAAPDYIREADMRDWCEQHLAPLLKGLSPELMHAFGEDFGRTGDLTVFTPLVISQQLKRIAPFMVELRNVPFKQQEQVMYYIIDRLPRFLAGHFDARGNGQYLAEQAQYRYGANRIEAVMISQSWYLDSMPKFKAALEDDELHVSRDADVLNDLRALQVIKGIPKLPDGNTGNSQRQRHGDSAISLVMAYNASLMEVEEFSYESVMTHTDIPSRPVKTGMGLGGMNRGLL